LLVALLFWALSAIGKGGLIASFSAADGGLGVTAGEGLGKGMAYLWKLLTIEVLVGLPTLLAGGILAIVAIAFTIGTLGLGLLCIWPLFILLIPVAIALSLYTLLTEVAVVVGDLGVFEAFGRAWSFLKAHWAPLIVMALILLLGGGIVAWLVIAPFLGAALPVIGSLVFGYDFGPALLGTVILALLYLPIALLLSGILQTFVTGAWTLTYRRLTGELRGVLAAA